MRLQKYLAQQGIASRRKAEEMIQSGRVRVNDRIVTELGTKIEPGKDMVVVDGTPIGTQKELTYILLYKPVGVVSTASDEFRRPTVVELVPKDIRVYPVGRLDYDSEGLILLTNDGELTYRLTHPRFELPKTYQVTVWGHPSDWDLKSLATGVELSDGITAKADVMRLKPNMLEIVLREGRNRQIRRMLSALGYEVINLKRIAIGSLKIGSLTAGEYRYLSQQEVDALYIAVGLR